MRKATMEKIVNAINKEIAITKTGWYTIYLTDNITVHCTRVRMESNLVMFYDDGKYIGSCLVKSVEKVKYLRGL